MAGLLGSRALSLRSSSDKEHASKRIEDIRVGERVYVGYGEGYPAGAAQPDPLTWRLLRLRADHVWDDGTHDDIHIETLQSQAWIVRHNSRLGSLVPLPLDLLDMGLPRDLEARVIANDPCPMLSCGPGRLVLTTVNHLNSNVRELTVRDPAGRRESIWPTGLHKFYSEPAGWVSAQDLKPGQFLRSQSCVLEVLHNTSLPGIHRVYNLTVEGEHVYHVSSLGALVHNNGCAQLRVPVRPAVATDSAGRIISSSASILPENLYGGTGTTRAARALTSPDDAGHIIGRLLGGQGGATSNNVMAQLPAVNRGGFRAHEALVAAQVKAGKSVHVQVELIYPNATTVRPSAIRYHTTVDGVTTVTNFGN